MVTGIGDVEINGNSYYIKGPLIEGVVEEVLDVDGRSTSHIPIDRRGKSSWVVKEVLGLGGFDLDAPEEAVYVQASAVETRFGETTNGLFMFAKSLDSSFVAAENAFLHEHKGVLGLFATRSTTSPGVQTYTSDQWGNSSAIVAATSVTRMHDAITLGDDIYVFFVDNNTAAENVSVFTSATTGGSYTDKGDASVSAGGQVADRIYVWAWSPDVTILAAYDDSAQEVQVFKNIDAWATTGVTRIATIPASGLNGIGEFYNSQGSLQPIVGLSNGVWAIDPSLPDNEELIVDLIERANATNCLGMVVWNGVLIVPLADSGMEALVWENGLSSRPVSAPPRFEAAAEGTVTATFPTDDWLFVAYGGQAASTNAHIYAIDSQLNWHCVAKFANADEEITEILISASDDDTPRLHWILSKDDTTTSYEMENPLENPRHTLIKGRSSSQITYPEFTGGSRNIDKLFLRILADADDVSATTGGEYINLDYGLGDNSVDTDLGNILSGTGVLTFGSGVGVVGKSITLRATFLRDSSPPTDRCYLRTFELEYLVIPNRRATYEMVIDLETTASGRGGDAQPKDINDELNTIQGSKTMVTLSFDGRTAVYVIAEPKTATEHELETRFEIQGFSHRVDRYMKLTELL